MTPIQIIAVISASVILIKTIADFKKNKITLPVFLFWTILWSLIIVITALPQALGFVDKLFGEGRALDAITYFSIIFIFYILFKIAARIDSIESNITTIIREITLKNKDK